MAEHPSLQERYAPRAVCFGCGPANPDGLHIRSFVAGEPGAPAWSAAEAGARVPTAPDQPETDTREAAGASDVAAALVAEWLPQPRFEAFEGALNGGVIGTLLDCHSNWAATFALMRRSGVDRIPSTVTADYAVRMRRPTPTRHGPLHLRARVVELRDDRAVVESTIEVDGETCVSFRGTFVAVGPGHPAYGRW